MRPIRTPIALFFSGAVGLASLLTLVEASMPGPSIWVMALALYWVTLAIGMAWLVRVQGPGERRRVWESWMFVPVALALGTALMVKLDAPLHARFALSEASLERYARSVTDDYASRRWWGLYWVDEVEKIPGGARFMVTSHTLDWKSYGFAYIPDRLPDPAEGMYEHFKGPWYLWTDGP